MNTILEFAFVTEECKFWQEWVTVKSDKTVDYAAIKNSIAAYMKNEYCGAKGYADIVSEIMNKSGYEWDLIITTIPESQAIYTFWI